MKKGFLILLIFLCCFGVTACREGEEVTGVSVVTSNFPLYDFVRAIGGEQVNVTMLIKPGSESHSYEPTPKEIIAIEQADLFLYIGGESEAWVESLSRTDAIPLLDVVETKEEHEGHDHGADEHIWTSPKNAMKMAEAICEELSRVDPQHQEMYQQNLDHFLEELTRLDERFFQIVQKGTRKKVVFGDRFPFLYFAERYGLSYLAAFPGCASQAEPSAGTMAELIDTVKKEEIPVVFYLELSNQSIAKSISEATGAEMRLFHSCHNVSRQEFEEGETYLSLMNQNAEQLEEALH
ncbi:MAG: zinc ABC transporter substrate-binding protein [Ruminococcaceae bacterium]|nr:zinc ABC transporter substrate-binding protein [Oscillospiraceae bacterium]